MIKPVRSNIDLSVILPCYRATAATVRSTQELKKYSALSPLRIEVIVVDDGDSGLADALADFQPFTRVLTFPVNRGKGAAIRAGFEQASGRVIAYTDADLPYGLDSLAVAAHYILEKGFHAVVGDRTLPQSRYDLNVTSTRRMASAIFSTVAGRLITRGYFDTQCGLKAFRSDVALKLAGLSKVDRFAFDVELLAILVRARVDIKRIPVQLDRNEGSTVRVGRDSLRMCLDLAQMMQKVVGGGYQSAYLQSLAGEESDNLAARLHV